MSGPASISVVIPCLDEARLLPHAIQSVRAEADEVIVVDGGSRDDSAAVAQAAGATLLRTAPNRGSQLASGAAAACGDWLVFLHADTRLERGWAQALAPLRPRVAGGAFRLCIDAAGSAYRLVERAVALRTRVLHMPYGDQALFARRAAYRAAGGFRPLPLMEDLDFVRRLGRVGRLHFPTVHAVTSARRWQRHGVLGATLRNWRLLGLYLLGTPPARLAELYQVPAAHKEPA